MPTYYSQRLPTTVTANTTVSIQALFDQAFGAGWSFPGGFSLYARSTASMSHVAENGQTSQFGFWDPQNKQDSYFKLAGAVIPLGESIFRPSGFASGELVVGNALTPLALIAVQNSPPGAAEPIYTWYSVTVVPAGMAAPAGAPITGAAMAAKGLEFARSFGNVPLLWDCGWIVESVAGAIGAPMPTLNYSINPAQNQEGGFWRIIHRGDTNPLEDWQALVQPGDVVRMKWKGAGFHTTLVISGQDAAGKITVVDNGGPSGEIVHRTVNYDIQTRPESITIYRLTKDGLNLLSGGDGAETLNGSTATDDLRGGGGDDTLRAGPGDDRITPGLGDDTIDGAAGVDTAWINATRSDVRVSVDSTGAIVLVSSDGRDNLKNVEFVHFSSGETVPITSLMPPAPIVSTYAAAALSQVITGANPTAAEMDVRTSAAIGAYQFYSEVLKVANPNLGPYESLGVSFSGLASFQTKFGGGDTQSFVLKAYQTIFMRAPTAEQSKAFSGQVTYFTDLYVKAGASTSTADIQARGAVVGQMIGYVMTVPSESARPEQTIDDKAIAFATMQSSLELTGVASASFSSFDTLI